MSRKRLRKTPEIEEDDFVPTIRELEVAQFDDSFIENEKKRKIEEHLDMIDKEFERDIRKKNRSSEQKEKDKLRHLKYNKSEKGKKRTKKAQEK